MTMTAEVLVGQRGRPFTRADLETMPDDGRRYELIDGALIVTPGPFLSHQVLVFELGYRLRTRCPKDLRVLSAPFDVALGDATVIQPDVLVALRSDLTERDLPAAPLLAVEVLSPSTRSIDIRVKKDLLERAGCPHYWVVDPDDLSVTAWDLVDGAYQAGACAVGEETFTVREPFDVSFTPAELVE